MKKQNENLWAIILAGGDGIRLREYLKTNRNIDRPKQFANIVGTHSMLRHTIERVKRIVPLQRMRIVVNIQHLKYVHTEISETERKSLVVLPCNRETAVSILFPVVQILAQDPSACVTVFPSDHFILEEERFMNFVESAVDYVHRSPETVVLVGIPSKDADTNYGWIEPSTSFLRYLGNRFYAVERFVEKPPIKLATMLHSKKCLWNSMVFAAQAETLLHLYRKSLPKVYHQMNLMKQLVTSPGGIEKLDGQFTRLPSYGFSKTIMEPNAKHLRVIRAEGIAWSDWGNQSRVASDLSKMAIGLQ
ncbi:MAG: sugar phosphate nucleotidyltransferase [Bacteroidota bacterium]|jgi:mannose-1-phosphate guanylyltransferase